MMDKSLGNKIPFGLKKGILFHVSDVVSGLACGCVCPSCNGKLQANKGDSKKRVHYFSHDPASNSSECINAVETSIHLMAKQILKNKKYSIFPMLEISMSMNDKNGQKHIEKATVIDKTLLYFNDVTLEKKLANIRPDIIAYTSDQKQFLIEIAVTHFSDKEKKEKIRRMGLFAIEINLSDISYSITEEDLTTLITDEFNNKKWLSNPDSVKIKKELQVKLEKKIRNNKKIFSERKNKSLGELLKTYPEKKFNNLNLDTPSNQQYDPRWFLCESCRNIFSKILNQAPYSLERIECPECEYLVSTKDYMD